jgi:hypothetical protein
MSDINGRLDRPLPLSLLNNAGGQVHEVRDRGRFNDQQSVRSVAAVCEAAPALA